MCTTCGCGAGEVTLGGHGQDHENDGGHGHHHHHDHGHHPEHGGDHGMKLDYGAGPAHAHAPGMSQARMVKVEQDILGQNNAYAGDNRRYFATHGIFALNLVSSPGSGKTTLLAATIAALRKQLNIAVIEGDQQTSRDAERIRATGVATIQINTGKGCHLDAHMIGHALERLSLPDDALLFIENVGNLVCPAVFDLGEAHKVVILSVTEGDDKPLKYPDMFQAADLMLLNKVDLLPYVDFDVERCIAHARRVNPSIQALRVSATGGQGTEDWLGWVEQGWRQTVGQRRQAPLKMPFTGAGVRE